MNYQTAALELITHPNSFRATVLAVLVVFFVATFFTFTMYISLQPQPAQALFGIDAAIKIAFEIAKAVAKAIALMIAVRATQDLVVKLEQNHVIRNILFYADALEADVYIGNTVNKLTGVGETQETALNASSTIGDIIGQIGNTNFPGQTEEEIIGLALLNASANTNLDRQGAGLTPAEEAMLTRVGVTLLTSHAQCGGSRGNNELVGKIALYNAARALAYNPSDLDPRDGTRFYQQLGHYGNPFANRYFQELNLRDVAGGVEAEARRAAQAELLGNGTKALRNPQFGVTRTGSAINQGIVDIAGKAYDAAIESSDNAFVQSIIRVILNIAQSVIFTPQGRVLSEKAICDDSSSLISPDNRFVQIPDQKKSFITANGKTQVVVKPGTAVDLNWFTGIADPRRVEVSRAFISGVTEGSDTEVEHAGTLVVRPEETTLYELIVETDIDDLLEGEQFGGGGDDPGGIVQGKVLQGFENPERGPGSDGEGFEQPVSCRLSLAPNTISQGGTATLSWNSQNSTGGDISPGIGTVASEGSITVSPDKTTTYHGVFEGERGSGSCQNTLSVVDQITPGDQTQRVVIASASVVVDESGDSSGGGGGGGNSGSGSGGGSDNTSFTGDDPSPAPPTDIAAQVQWLHTDVSGWSITSNLGNPGVFENQICLDHTKRGEWPVFDFGTATEDDDLEGNPWIFASINGQWYAGTYEWLRPGQECKSLEVPEKSPTTREALGPHIKRSPMEGWKPRKGETVGFMVSTLARGSERNGNERSNVVWINWPF